MCSIFVEDNGPGLTDGALERSLSGASLGLGLVSGLAAQLHGELRILPGFGARFELRFPYPRTQAPPVSSPS
jgi:two-component sensor histidine kinase